MKDIYTPNRYLSIDKSMVLWRGRLVFRQYVKIKSHKYGVKFFEVCTLDGIILPVKSIVASHFLTSKILDNMVIMNDFLWKGYHGYHGYHGFTGNYYNSYHLQEGYEHSTYLCGTLWPDRIGNEKKLKRGEMVWMRNVITLSLLSGRIKERF